jgi:hypothetical protein
LRAEHEKPDGYQISVSRTVSTPLTKLYRNFASEKSRRRWLAEDGLLIRKATANKSMRVTWKDGQTSLEINFLSKGDEKSQVVVQHSKLPDVKSAARMKRYWEGADRLRDLLEQ